MKSLSLLFVLFCWSFLAIAGTLKLAPNDDTVQIIRAEFGLFNESGFIPTNTVPLVVGQNYGWRIELKTNKPIIKWREQFILPATPKTWGDVEQQGLSKLSNDKRVSVMEREVTPENGVIFNAWAVAPGDPKGSYIMRVLIDKRDERIFQFNVQPVTKRPLN